MSTDRPPSDEGFRIYLASFKRRADEDAVLLEGIPSFVVLERALQRLMYVIDREGKEDVAYPAGNAGIVLKMHLAKLITEAFAFLGSVRYGSLLGAHHHLRAMMEVQACVKYVFDDPAQHDLRVRKFTEYALLAGYLRRKRSEVIFRDAHALVDKGPRMNNRPDHAATSRGLMV